MYFTQLAVVFDTFAKILVCQVFTVRFFGFLRPCFGGVVKSGSFMAVFPPCSVLQHSAIQGFNGCRITVLVIL
nr:MAG TPA: hypothetical protein [Caudoviricetes sp.]